MATVKSKKSGNFDRNLNSRAMVRQIESNTWASSEILKDASNNIAPIENGDLRQETTTKKQLGSGFFSHFVYWNAPYAKIRYEVNKKNPKTTKWIEKGFAQKSKVLMRKMREGVLK